MPDYRRAWHPGGTYFFTVNLLQRRGNDLLTRHINTLREVVQSVRLRHPFIIHGWIVLPEHLHCVIELPENDQDFSTRWRLIKSDFSKTLPKDERRSEVRVKCVNDWPYSTFHRLVERGIYPLDWAGGDDSSLDYSD